MISINGQGGLLDVLYYDQYLYFSTVDLMKKLTEKKLQAQKLLEEN